MSKMMIGKVINQINIAADKGALQFVCSDGNYVVRADGDCCSHTWVEHVELPALGFPATILAINDLPMPDQGQPDEYGVLAYYGCKITTDKGDIVIDYRNSSNGYYGGNLSWPDDDYFYGGVHGQNISKEEWQAIP